MTPRRSALIAIVVATAIAASACSPSAPRQPIPPPATTPVPEASPTESGSAWWRPADVATLATGLVAPWSVVPLGDGGALVSLRGDGTVLEVVDGGDVRSAGEVPGVVSGGESGLHGLALLDTEDARWLYAYHGAADDNRVVRMPLTGVAGSLELGSPEPVLTGIARARTHNGGRIAFGPDGYLYVATGDAGDPSAAQDPASLNGKILRLAADGSPAPANPWGTAVWSLGHRNVQGLAWTADDTMWASEFGQNAWDELNRIEPGANYGWPEHEGTAQAEGFADPLVVWPTAEASPSGLAAIGDSLFLASLRGERLWIVDVAAGELAVDTSTGGARDIVAALDREQGRLRDAVAAPDGSVWVLTNNTDGRGSPRDGDDVLLRLRLSPID